MRRYFRMIKYVHLFTITLYQAEYPVEMINEKSLLLSFFMQKIFSHEEMMLNQLTQDLL